MGISDLWPILSLLSNDRIPFPVFLSRFIDQHGRPPRLAIDAYMFMFWSQLPGSDVHDPSMERRIVRNFMAKLWYLVQCNVLFVVVFDGKFKPGKLRNGHIPDLPETCSYDDSLHYFKKLHHSYYNEGLRLIDSVIKLLSRNCMDWVQAPGEAEAECAWLQKLGIVDYVVSDDSDTLVFGATRVLRMFNRVKYFNDENEPVLSSTDYYVTPIHMSHITERTSLTRDHLVLIAVLRGGDYSSGAEGIGITRAKEIALCGTTVLLHLPRKAVQDFGSFPDVTLKFTNIFIEQEKVGELLPDPFHGLKPALDRDEGLRAFNIFLDDFLVKNGKKVFGRMTNFKNKVMIDEFYALLYYFPFVNRRLFKFTPSSITFAEPQAICSDLSTKTVLITVPRVNSILSLGIIGNLICEASAQQFVPSTDFKVAKIAMPRERKANLKPLVLKLIRDLDFWSVIELYRKKEFEGITMGVLRFSRLQLNEKVYYSKKIPLENDLDSDLIEDTDQLLEVQLGEPGLEKSDPSQDGQKGQFEEREAPNDGEIEDKLITFHVPLQCVKYASPEFVEQFEKEQSKKKSPKKKKSPQKTTLDSIWPMLLPTKDITKLQRIPASVKLEAAPPPLEFTTDENPFQDAGKTFCEQDEDVVIIERKELPSPSKKLPSRRRIRRNEIAPGQTTLTSFFERKEKINRFHESLFVASDDESEEGTFKLPVPQLKYKVPRPLSPSSSTELSPTKQTRRSMRLSPDVSPVKAKLLMRDLHG